MPTKATWKEYFYDGECYVIQGRIETYKPHWIAELTGNRGFSVEPEAEPTVTEPVQEQAQPSGQEVTEAERPSKKRSKGAKNENNE